MNYGAIPKVDTTSTAIVNAKAFEKAILAANSSVTDREVLIPGGHSFTMMPVFNNFI